MDKESNNADYIVKKYAMQLDNNVVAIGESVSLDPLIGESLVNKGRLHPVKPRARTANTPQAEAKRKKAEKETESQDMK